MSFRREAKQKIYRLTSTIVELWIAPFRHVNINGNDRRMHTELRAFQSDFERLTVMLFEAQQYGAVWQGAEAYLLLQERLERRYRDLRPFLIAFDSWPIDEFERSTVEPDSSEDIFRSLWEAPSLSDFVESDDVFFSDRVARANETLKYYNEHLKYLDEAA